MLLVEDDYDDVRFFHNCLKHFDLAFTLQTLMMGDEVLPYLHSTSVLPDIIILDLNLPRQNGIEILRSIKAEEKFRHIITVVYTTSSAEADRQACLREGVNLFLTKANTLQEHEANIVKIIAELTVSRQ